MLCPQCQSEMRLREGVGPGLIMLATYMDCATCKKSYTLAAGRVESVHAIKIEPAEDAA